jgi:uncharacterized protein
MDLEAFELVLLHRPPDAPDYSAEELDRIQAAHVGFLDDMRASGQLVTNGPLDGQPDPSLRGVAVYRTGSVERSRELAEGDPAVRAGRLAVSVMTWFCPPGTMSRPGRAVTLA